MQSVAVPSLARPEEAVRQWLTAPLAPVICGQPPYPHIPMNEFAQKTDSGPVTAGAVFLSYARAASRHHAEAVYDALGGSAAGTAFLDTEEIETGDRFPDRLIDALLAARVVVIFADETYFKRWYCLLELRIARTPFVAALGTPGVSPEIQSATTASFVLALPRGEVTLPLEHFPPFAQITNWPHVDQPTQIANCVRERLATQPHTIGHLLQLLHVADVAGQFREAARLPAPQSLAGVRRVPLEIKPSLHDAFVGRTDELWRIDNLLVGTGNTAALSSAVEGGGGIGKTRLALEYLYRFGPTRFRGGIFWIDADADAGALFARQHEILLCLEPDSAALEWYQSNPEGLRRDLCRAIENVPPDMRVLFIVDDIPEPTTGEAPKPLSFWCPAVGLAPIIATSRIDLTLTSPGAIVPVRMDVLDEEAAIRLLIRHVRNAAAASPQQLLEIVEWVGRLPLALELLNALLRARGVTLDTLLNQSRTRSSTTALDEALESLRIAVPPGSLRGVTEALSLSYEKLDPAVRIAARVLAWLAPEPIPEALIGVFGPELFSLQTRAVLCSRSFVTREAGGPTELFGSMHRVLSDFVRTKTADSLDELKLACEALLRLMPRENCEEFTELPLLEMCLPHAIAVHRSISDRDRRGQLANVHAELGLSIAELLHTLGRYGDSAMTYARVALRSRRLLGRDHPSAIAALDGLAVARRPLIGIASRSRRSAERVIAMCERSLSPDHPVRIRAVHNYAAILTDQREFNVATPLWRQIVAQKRQQLRPENPSTLRARLNLAYCLREDGELEGARADHEEIVETCVRLLGPSHRLTNSAKRALAETLRREGELQRACTLLREAVSNLQTVLPDSHPELLSAVRDLSELLGQCGEFDEALSKQQRVLALCEKVYGDTSIETVIARSHIATTLEARGDLAHSLRIREEVASALLLRYGRDNHWTVKAEEMLDQTRRLHKEYSGGDAATIHENLEEKLSPPFDA